MSVCSTRNMQKKTAFPPPPLRVLVAPKSYPDGWSALTDNCEGLVPKIQGRALGFPPAHSRHLHSPPAEVLQFQRGNRVS